VRAACFLVPGRWEGQVRFTVRPENIVLTRREAVSEDQRRIAIVVTHGRSVDLGAYVRVELHGPLPLVAHMPHRAFTSLKPNPQTDLLAVVHPESVHVLCEDKE
jgi:hypothetical protein